ncbi:MAG: type IV secretory system conjugative DNA transfer family protein [Planctomycetes bacterium]|nr:type IV secretory system conjugative DNA transfer family protein [Planctomycetota bacterium]
MPTTPQPDPDPKIPGLRHLLPRQLAAGDIPLGWALSPPASLGFRAAADRSPARRARRLATFTGDGHLAVFARTGSGKSRGCTIPWLLQLPNSTIVLDIKAEAYHCTARWRRDHLGHRIAVLDAFGLVGGRDRLNPFDLVRGDHLEEDADVLTELFLDGHASSLKDPFWDACARAFLVGCIAHVATRPKPSPRQLRDLLSQDDIAYALALLLDQKQVESPLAQREITRFLNHEKDKVRPSVLSTAQQHLRAFAGEKCLQTLERSTIALDDVIGGDGFTIYIVIPPENMTSHGPLLRLWIGTLLQAVTRRRRRPDASTLFLLDEIAQCGTLPILRQALTLLRGYGLTTITLWQDLAQMQRLYDDWRTLLNNCAVVATFGASTFEMARTLGDVIGVAPDQLRAMPVANALFSLPGGRPFEVRRLDYLTDRFLRERSAANPWFAPGVDPEAPER